MRICPILLAVTSQWTGQCFSLPRQVWHHLTGLGKKGKAGLAWVGNTNQELGITPRDSQLLRLRCYVPPERIFSFYQRKHIEELKIISVILLRKWQRF